MIESLQNCDGAQYPYQIDQFLVNTSKTLMNIVLWIKEAFYLLVVEYIIQMKPYLINRYTSPCEWTGMLYAGNVSHIEYTRKDFP